MKHLEHGRYIVTRNDAIAKVWWDTKEKKVLTQGKRVSKDCPLTREERRAYVKGGSVSCVKLIRARLNCSIREALDVLREARKFSYL